MAKATKTTTTKTDRRGPFDFVGAINKHYDIVREDPHPQGLKNYEPFVINRAFSYHQDTLHAALQMNTAGDLSKIMQYDFLINTVRPRPRFGKWAKPNDADKVKLIARYFETSPSVARYYIGLMQPEDVDQIITLMTNDDDSGGVIDE